MKNRKILSLLALATCTMISCSDNDAVNGKIALGFGASTSSGSTAHARTLSAVAFTDFKINIREIEFELAESEFEDEEDAATTKPAYTDDVKLKGPFVLDLLDQGTAVDNMVATIDIPNAVYEEVEFKFHKNGDASSPMYGKSVMISGTIGGTPFEFWHDTDEEFEIDFEDAAQDLVVDGNELSVTIQMNLGQLLHLSSIDWEKAEDGNGNGIIEIHPNDEDGNKDIAHAIKVALEDITDLIDDKR